MIEQSIESLASGTALAALTEQPGFSLVPQRAGAQQRFGGIPAAAPGRGRSVRRRLLRRDSATQRNLLGRTGRLASAETTDDHRLLRLTARWAPDDSGYFKRLVIEKTDAGFTSRIETARSPRPPPGRRRDPKLPVCRHRRRAHPRRRSRAGGRAVSGDIDFRRSLRKGDRFSIVYETLEADGEPCAAARVLSAEF